MIQLPENVGREHLPIREGADEVLVADLLAATKGTDVEETVDVAALGRAEFECSGSEVASVHQCHVEDYMDVQCHQGDDAVPGWEQLG